MSTDILFTTNNYGKTDGIVPMSTTYVFMSLLLVLCFSNQPTTRELSQVVEQLMKHSRCGEYFTTTDRHMTITSLQRTDTWQSLHCSRQTHDNNSTATTDTWQQLHCHRQTHNNDFTATDRHMTITSLQRTDTWQQLHCHRQTHNNDFTATDRHMTITSLQRTDT